MRRKRDTGRSAELVEEEAPSALHPLFRDRAMRALPRDREAVGDGAEPLMGYRFRSRVASRIAASTPFFLRMDLTRAWSSFVRFRRCPR